MYGKTDQQCFVDKFDKFKYISVIFDKLKKRNKCYCIKHFISFRKVK